MSKQKYLTIVSLKKFQHYHDRHMVWMKWYMDCLQNSDFMTLTEQQKWLFIGLICLACKSNNTVIYDIGWLEKVLNTSNIDKNVAILIDRNMIASCYQNAIPIREDKIREDKTNTLKPEPLVSDVVLKAKPKQDKPKDEPISKDIINTFSQAYGGAMGFDYIPKWGRDMKILKELSYISIKAGGYASLFKKFFLWYKYSKWHKDKGISPDIPLLRGNINKILIFKNPNADIDYSQIR